MNLAPVICQPIGLAEQISGKYANIQTIFVALDKLCYRLGWVRSQLSRSSEVHRLGSLGLCASTPWL